jgi:alkanesulfonate monooxygenase SsuD/methylene tetrahydromethanopterin reductase-like flavin-dependent oxidoreductase (luciferase family)
MEYGTHLPLIDFGDGSVTLPRLQKYATVARDLGFRCLAANDHLIFPKPWLDGPTMLAAVLTESGDMTLATTVALPAVRGPFAFARATAALDLLSGGRLLVAVGPGSSPLDYHAAGIPFEERWKRLEESVQVLRALWNPGGPSFSGLFYSTQGAVLLPAPAQPGGPPIWIGSWGSPLGLRRVARFADGWLASAYNTTPERFAQALAKLREALASEGKDADAFPNGLGTAWTFISDDADEAERVLRDVVAALVRRPPDELRGSILVGTREQCRDRLRAYRDAGVQRLLIWPVRDDLRQLEVFMQVAEGV